MDTFELAEAEQASLGFMTEENAERVKRQKQSPIFVIIGNPPYNAWQVNENDNNRNRNYPDLDTRIATVYARGSEATNKIALSDPYVKAFMWASDRLGKEGIVAFVSNNGFLDGVAFDGMREDLSARFAAIYHLNLKGNARTSGDRRQREGGNIFDDQIRVGVGITLLVKKESDRTSACRILVHSVEDYLPSEKKRGLIEDHSSVSQIEWEALRHRARDGWSATTGPDASDLPLMGNTEGKKGSRETGIVFQIYSRGAETTRDSWVYNFSARDLTVNVTRMIETYNMEVDRWTRSPRKDVDAFVVGDDRKIKWSSRLKELLQTGVRTGFHEAKIRRALYRPFTAEFLYFDDVLNHRRGRLPESLPNPQSERENVLIVTSDIASRSSFSVLVTSIIPDLHLCAGVDAFQCFPFYTYAEDGTHRRENITDWALDQFRSHYADLSISKWDIFHYVYAVLHHPDYRERYAANLRRELPRIPFVGTGAEALNNSAAPDAGLKPGSSTDPTIGATAESASDARTTVEERPFKGRAEKRRKESNSTL
ncbi:MAG TPA: type ISP restriction/modification enzyme, partial [Nitrospira sp.]|nr:type ISP restriction/modification enzyme [Nitrospira sp.]